MVQRIAQSQTSDRKSFPRDSEMVDAAQSPRQKDHAFLPEKLSILEDQPLQTDLKMCPGLFIKITTFAAGSFIPQHSHETAHLSVVATGAVRAWKDGVLLGEFRAPAGITIDAHAKHMFEALETNTMILCVHRVDDGDEPDIHDEHIVETV